MAQPTDAALRAAATGGGNVTFGFDGVVALTNTIPISADTVIDGSGRNVVISGEGAVRLFMVSSGVRLHLKNLTLANGRGTNGGAILNEGGVLEITGSTFSNNVARGLDGAAGQNGTNGLTMAPAEKNHAAAGRAGDGQDGSAGLSGQGGAIYSIGTLRITNSVFVANAAIGGNGGTGGAGGNSGTNNGSCLCAGGHSGSGGRGGIGGFSRGGGIFSRGTSIVIGATFLTNKATGGAGGSAGAAGMNYGTDQPYGLPGRSATGGNADGGALVSYGFLTVSNCAFAGNLAEAGHGGNGSTGYQPYYGGGGDGSHAASGGDAAAGALFAAGTNMIVASTFEGSVASGGVGGVGGVGGNAGNHDFVPGGTGGNGGAGGLAQGGAADLAGSNFLAGVRWTNNAARGGTGGIGGLGGAPFNFLAQYLTGESGASGKGGDAWGGGAIIKGDRSRLIGSVLVRNVARGGPGGDGSSLPVVFTPDTAGRGGVARGGALYSLSDVMLETTLLSGNLAEGGAGGGGSSLYQNRYAGEGGGSGAQGGNGEGGGVFNVISLQMNRCTIDHNEAIGGSGGRGGRGAPSRFDLGGNGGRGGQGGSAAGGGIYSLGSSRLTNSTICYNAALAGAGGGGGLPGMGGGTCLGSSAGGSGGTGGTAAGGGLEALGAAQYLTHVTLAHNAVLGGPGGRSTLGLPNCDGTRIDGNPGVDGVATAGGIDAGTAPVTFHQSLLAHNTPLNCVAGDVADLGVNLSSDASQLLSSGLTNINPMLGGLGDHGGPTPTMALLQGSPAIDRITNGFIATDQRGTARASGVAADIGAFEATELLYALQGRVMLDEAGVPGIPITDGVMQVITDRNGSYQFPGRPAGSYVVSPSFLGATFVPADASLALPPSRMDVAFAITNAPLRVNLRAFASGITISLSGLPHRQCVLETSTNLLNWDLFDVQPMGSDGRLLFTYPASTEPKRFFRPRLE